MRVALPALAFLLLAAAPAAAQREEPLDRRLERIERELRAVQRKVFPGGAGLTVEPEISPTQPSISPMGVPATNPVADLSARIDALEAQLRSLTSQTEENGHRIRQLEQGLTALKTTTESRPEGSDRPAASLPAEETPAASSETPAAAAGGSEAERGEAAYSAGYRQWNAGQFAEAQKTLEGWVKQYPKHSRASYAQNLLGRAYLDGGKPATAAKTFLANYQANPKGDRAQDSLYFLGSALVRLSKKSEACKVYDELQDVYGASMRDWVKQRLSKARSEATCK